MKLKISELVFDPEIYPRGRVDSYHVERLREAFRAGAEFGPLSIDSDGKRIIDGAHRREVYRLERGDDFVVECMAKKYANEGDMFLDAMRSNARHGLPLSEVDRARCALKCRRFGLGAIAIAQALGMTVTKLRAVSEGLTAVVAPEETSAVSNMAKRIVKKPVEVVLKRSVQHLAGCTISPAQHETIKRLSDRRQADTVEEMIRLAVGGLLDRSDEALMGRVRHLSELLSEMFASATVV